jgi:hypothetical protein
MKPLFALISLFVIVSANGQQFNSDFKTIAVNKKVKEFPDRFDQSSPLNSFMTFRYTMMDGKDGMLWKTSCAVKKSLLPDSTAPDSNVPEDLKQSYLNEIVREIILYKDSTAFVITQLVQGNGEPYYSVRNFHTERGRWVNNGENLFENVEGAHENIRARAEFFYNQFRSCRQQLSEVTRLDAN